MSSRRCVGPVLWPGGRAHSRAPLRRTALGGALALLLAALPAAAQISIADPPPDRGGIGVLEVALSATEITVGDRLEARLTLVWTGPTPASEPRFPPWQETWGRAEVLSAGEVETFSDQGARRIYRQTVVLTAFTTGAVLLPRVTVALPLEAETIEISGDHDAGFEVRSVLPENAGEAEPRPPAPPQPLAAGRRFPWTAGTLGGLGVLMVWLLGRRLGENGASAAAPAPAPTEPLAELLQRLQQLDASAGEPTHTGLSLALRGFLGRSLVFPATESTTSEIRDRLGTTRVAPAITGGTVRLLADCDQVKFAQAPVTESVTGGRLVEARDLAREIDRSLAQRSLAQRSLAQRSLAPAEPAAPVGAHGMRPPEAGG